MIALTTIPVRAWVERRWRWSWLWMRWEVQILSEDYVFRWNGGWLEGLEDWIPT